MRIFGNLRPDANDYTLSAATKAVLERLEMLPVPRSLCEIRADDEDYEWLRKWAQGLTPNLLDRWLTRDQMAFYQHGSFVSTQEAAGLLLMLLASEAARRESSEDSLWPTVRRQFAPDAELELFGQGQPRQPLKNAFEVAAQRFELRHVFGQAHGQEYFITVKLQFGFTRKGISRLPLWLAGQAATASIQYLNGMNGDRLASDSFVKLWEALRDFRMRYRPERRAREAIVASPWVLPIWADELLKQSRTRLELGTAEPTEGDLDDSPPELLSDPRLQWDGHSPPRFVSVVNPAMPDLNLDEGRYRIRTGGQTVGRLFRQYDGGYSADPDDIGFPADAPELYAELVDDFGRCVADQTLMFWDPIEDVELFYLQTGERLGDAWQARIAPNRQYALLVSDDLVVEPSGMPSRPVGGGKRLYLMTVPVGASPVSVRLDGEELWNSGWNVDDTDKPAEPYWASAIDVAAHPDSRVRLADSSARRLRISGLPVGASLGVRVDGKPLDVERDNADSYVTEEFEVTGFMARSAASPVIEARLRIRGRDGGPVDIRRRVRLSVEGTLRMTADGWEVVRASKRLSTTEAARHMFKIMPPLTSDTDRRNLAIREGGVFVQRLPKNRARLNALVGYGAPLQVHDWGGANALMTISEEVYNPGVVEICKLNSEGRVRLHLSQPIEAGENHSVTLWTPGNTHTTLTAAAVTHPDCDFSIWDISVDQFSEAQTFVAIAYEGARIGAWFPNSFGYPINGSQPSLDIAAMLRWMRAPILSRNWIDSVRQFAHAYPAETLRAWLFEDGLPDAFQQDSGGEAWLSAVRDVFDEWRTPSEQTALNVIRILGQDAERNDRAIFLAALKALRFDAELMRRVMTPLNATIQSLLDDRAKTLVESDMEADSQHELTERSQFTNRSETVDVLMLNRAENVPPRMVQSSTISDPGRRARLPAVRHKDTLSQARFASRREDACDYPLYAIDAGLAESTRRSLPLIVAKRRCYMCGQDMEDQEIIALDMEFFTDRIVEHCSTQPDYLMHDTPMKEAIFRVFLMRRNEPMNAEQISDALSQKWAMTPFPRDTSPAVIQRLLDNSGSYYCIAPVAD